ncbi:uncharacterized protein LOC117124382 [Anneissia japonica]|uniref:uncharacterized protein LOC117124382 n=1 Tax=Anneissia japonica TaxID=1529436 RepID=UPI0014255B5F|nr:uncharacterized protein LOC117124382 [Anneissia japonica]
MLISCFLQSDSKVETIIEVGIAPPPPTLQCRSTNISVFWCEWSKNYTGMKNNYTFQFKKPEESKWEDCPSIHRINSHKDMCTVASYPIHPYLVRVTAKNIFGSGNTTSKFNAYEEAIPLPPVIEKVLAGKSSIQVFWKLQEDFKYSHTLRYQLRYRLHNTNWTMVRPETRHKNYTIEVFEIGSKYEFEVRSKFLRKEFSKWGPKSVVSVPEPVNLMVTTTAPETTLDQFMLQWRKPAENKPSVEYYEISGDCTHQSLNMTRVDTNYIIFDVPCDNEYDERIVSYNFQVTAVSFAEEVVVKGQPSFLPYEFDCQKAVRTTKKDGLLTKTPSNHMPTITKEDLITRNPTDNPLSLVVPVLLVGILFLIGLLFWLCFQRYFHKQLFIKWPEPKFFKVEINATFQPRQIEKEVFDDLKTKSDCLPSPHSSTSSDQGFHELSPHLPIGKEKSSTYVRAPLVDSNETDYQVSSVKEGITEYLQLQQTGYHDILQLSPLQTDHKRIENNSDPYTSMPPMSSGLDKLPGSQTPLSYGGTDPYCKLHEVEPISSENDKLTQYIPVFEINETDYSAEDEDVINFEDEIQNLLNGAPKLETMNYVCQGDRQIL